MVDGSDTGFDGARVGVNGFRREDEDNDSLVVKTLIEEGCRLKLTQNGDILIKRDDNLNIFLYQNKESCSSDAVSKLPYGLIQQDKTYKLFDMKKFQERLSEELQSDHVNWSSLERQAVTMFSFAKFSDNILLSPVWVLVVNVVALHVIKTLQDSKFCNC